MVCVTNFFFQLVKVLNGQESRTSIYLHRYAIVYICIAFVLACILGNISILSLVQYSTIFYFASLMKVAYCFSSELDESQLRRLHGPVTKQEKRGCFLSC